MKLKKRKKASRMHGRGMGTHGWGSRKKHVGTSGHRGGIGMSGTGKKAGHKKTLINTLYNGKYFGRQGITSKSTKAKENKVMNLYDIEANLENLKKKADKSGAILLEDYKILGEGEIKSKVTIKARAASKSAQEKIAAAGGKLILEEASKQDSESKEAVEED